MANFQNGVWAVLIETENSKTKERGHVCLRFEFQILSSLLSWVRFSSDSLRLLVSGWACV